MSIRFLHCADGQLGKRFGSVTDPSKQEALRAARIQAIDRLAALAREQSVDFVLVAGDLFDSPTAANATISQALAKIGSIPAPVCVIPGNHDHAGPDSFWEQAFFRAEQTQLSPNLNILLQASPLVIEGKAIILPCPLLRRSAVANSFAWIGAGGGVWASLPSDLPRIILAHGTVQEFGTQRDDEDDERTLNFLDLSILNERDFDYIALGDWHGTKQVASKAWYAGALEPDRFPKGEAYQSGQALLVTIPARGDSPTVTAYSTGIVQWRTIQFLFQGESPVADFARHLETLLGDRVQQDALRFILSGSVSLEDDVHLTALLERYEARVLRFDLRRRPDIVPSEEEIQALSGRPGDPLIAAVSSRLQEDRLGPTPEVALEGLRQLFARVRQLESGGGGL
jgi:DNA repair exonuclease SbcCD nuclease subunit